MSKSNTFIYSGLKIVSWIIFVGLCIEAVGLLVNFIFSLFKPELVPYLYKKIDLLELFATNPWAYYGMYGFAIVIAFLKAVLFYVVIHLMTKMDLQKPFNRFVSKQIAWMSYFTFSIGLLSAIAKATARQLDQRGYDVNALNEFWVDSQAFILMSAVIYIIATIFNKGLEIQTENDLTV